MRSTKVFPRAQVGLACLALVLGGLILPHAKAAAHVVADNTVFLPLAVVADPLEGKIVYLVRHVAESAYYQIGMTDLDQRQASQFTHEELHHDTPALSPDGSTIAFAAPPEDGAFYDLYVMSSSGEALTRLTDNPGYDGMPAWSPDGRRLAYVSWRDGAGALYIMDADGRNERKVTDLGNSGGNPAWSPDGERLAFDENSDGNAEIYTIKTDGTDRIRLTDNPYNDVSPAWSPDGSRIAFVSERVEYSLYSTIYTMAADGADQTPITPADGVYRSYPTWSPDGQWLAFEAYDGSANTVTIFVMEPDGSGMREIIGGESDVYHSDPSWAR